MKPAILLLGFGMTGVIHAEPACEKVLSAADVAKAVGTSAANVQIYPQSGCMYVVMPKGDQILVSRLPGSEENYRTSYSPYPPTCTAAKPLSGPWAKAEICGKDVKLLNLPKTDVFSIHMIMRGLTPAKEEAVGIQLAQAIGTNTGAAVPVPEVDIGKEPTSILGAGPAVKGFHPDIRMCAAKQALEVDRRPMGEGVVGVAWTVIGVSERKAAEYFLWSLKKKGWAIRRSDFHEIRDKDKRAADRYDYKGTREILFEKGPYTVTVALSEVAKGLIVNLVQTKK